MKLVSNVRLGISLGVIDNISYDTINALLIEAQPATLMENAGKTMQPQERDVLRAKLVQEALH